MAAMYHLTCHNAVALENPDKTDGYTQPLTIFKNVSLLPTERWLGKACFIVTAC